jgi:molybdate transport system regulatory protein
MAWITAGYDLPDGPDRETLPTMTKQSRAPRLRIRLYFADGSMLGPGKADLLAMISETGSIAAAGRRMGMSYKRAWSLVDVMNSMFKAPLVASSRGGASHGGATLTETGEQVLALYRSLESKSRAGAEQEIQELEDLAAETTGKDVDMAQEK